MQDTELQLVPKVYQVSVSLSDSPSTRRCLKETERFQVVRAAALPLVDSRTHRHNLVQATPMFLPMPAIACNLQPSFTRGATLPSRWFATLIRNMLRSLCKLDPRTPTSTRHTFESQAATWHL